MKPTRAFGNGPRTGRVRVLGEMKTVRLPDLAEGQVECPVCRRGVLPLDEYRIRRHRDLFGHQCYNTSHGGMPDMDISAMVDWVRAQAPPEKEPEPPAVPRPPQRYVRTVCTSRCHTCDRPVTGERRFCGPCAANRGR